jgi:hypothetical protein
MAYIVRAFRTHDHIRAIGLLALPAPFCGDRPPIVAVERYFGFIVDYPAGTDLVL